MTQKDLDSPQVCAGFKQVGGETVAHGVSGDPLVQPGGLAGTLANLVDAPGSNGLAGNGAREENALWADSFPIGAKDLQQPWRKHDVTILPTLALADSDNHALAVDVGGLQLGDFRDAQAGGISRSCTR